MLDDISKELTVSISKAHEALKRDLSKLRAGRANPDLLSGVRVNYYGVSTPLSQMASVAAPEPRLLTVKAWDKSAIKHIEKALRESGLGLNPQAEADLIRLPLPPLTEERRKEFTKIAKKYGEECRVAIRKIRHDGLDMLHAVKEDGGASEDEVERAKKKVEDLISEAVKQIDHFVVAKEKDIMEV